MVRKAVVLVALALVACGKSRSPQKAAQRSGTEEAVPTTAQDETEEVTDERGFTAEQNAEALAALGTAPLEGGASNLDEIGRAAVEALNASDREALEALLVSEKTFKERLFLAIANHPSALKFGANASWDMTNRETRDDLGRIVKEHGGKDWTFVGIEPQKQYERPGLRLYRRPRLVVTGKDGKEQRLVLLGTVIEHVATSTFKLMSYRDST
jgi:hypothetical protein